MGTETTIFFVSTLNISVVLFTAKANVMFIIEFQRLTKQIKVEKNNDAILERDYRWDNNNNELIDAGKGNDEPNDMEAADDQQEDDVHV